MTIAIDISIVSYHSDSDALSGTIEALAQAAGEAPVSLRLTLTDNSVNSSDTERLAQLISRWTVDGLLDDFQAFFFRQNADNPGYGHANNLALKAGRGSWVLVMNPDVAIAPDALQLAAKHMASAKQCAMLALLATAPNGKRTRPWLQDTLWSLSGPDLGRASLRRALSDLRQRLGDVFAEIFEVTNDAIRLRLDRIEVIGTPADGAFLEGIDIPEEGFEDWLTQQRQAATAGLPRRHAPQGIALNLQGLVADYSMGFF